MKPHALILALSALSATAATAQTVGDRYGYDRPAYAPPSAYGAPYASQQGQPAVGRTLTWANKSAYSAPAPYYDPRRQNAYPSEQYSPPGRDYGPAPYAQAPQQMQGYAPASSYAAYPPSEPYRQPARPATNYAPPMPQYAPQAAPAPQGYAPGTYDRAQQQAPSYGATSNYAPYQPQDPYPRQMQPQANYPQPPVYADPPQDTHTYYIPPSRGPTTYIPVERPAMIQSPPTGGSGYRTEISSELSGGPAPVRQAMIEQYPAAPETSPVTRVAEPQPMPQPAPLAAQASQSAPAPMRVADAQPAERSQVHYYSLHRAYGLTPDTIPPPNPNQRMVLIGPGDTASAPKESSDKDDNTASEKPF